MRTFFLILAGIALYCSSIAQNITNYQFATSSVTFTVLGGAMTMPLSGGNTDDGWFNGVPVGFTFYYMGIPCTTISASTKGWMTFGQNISNAAYNNLLASGGTRPLVAPLWDDNDIQVNTHFSYLTTGTAPNRVFTAQWLDVKWKNTATSGGISFQVKLYETNGKVEFIYHPEAGALASPSASIGITGTATGSGNYLSLNNASSSPTASSVMETTTINSKPADGQVYSFSPPSPSPAPPISMSFTDITKTSMIIGWTDNSTTETWFETGISQDGVSYSPVGAVTSTTTAGTGTSYSISKTGLLPGVTYYYRITAKNEGNPPSAYLSGNQASAAPTEITSGASGNWTASSTWSTGTVPTALDNVTIGNTHTVIIDGPAECNALTVGEGSAGILRYGTVVTTLTTIQGITVATGGIFDAGAPAGANLGHTLKIGGTTAGAMGTGRLVVNGTIDMHIGSSNGKCTITFLGIPDATIEGTGTIDFYRVILNKGAVTATPTITPPVLEVLRSWTTQGSATTGFLYTHTAGTLKIGGSFSFSNPVFISTGYDIPDVGGFWLDNPSFFVTALAGSPSNNGLLRLENGTYNIGTTASHSMSAASGAVFMIENGTMNVSGKINATTAVNWIQSGGTVNITTVGNSTSNTPGFGLQHSGSAFTMSGGSICHVMANTGTVKIDYYNNAGTTNITGGLLQLGNSSSGAVKTFHIRGTTPNVILTNTSANHNCNLAGNLVIKGDLTLNGTGTFSNTSNSLTMTGMNTANPGNITVNTGANLTLNTAAAASLSFTGTTGNQFLNCSGTISSGQLAGLTINNNFGGAGTVTIPGGLTMVGDATLNLANGTLNVGTGLTLGTGSATGFSYIKGNGQVTGSLTRNYGSGVVNYAYNGSSAQLTGTEIPLAITGTFTIGNLAGVTLNSALQTAKFTLTEGTLFTTATNILTIAGLNPTDVTYATGQVNGPMQITLPASLVSGSAYHFPLGKSAYRPLKLVNPVTNAGGTVVIRAEVFDAAAGGTPGPSMMTLNTNRYWYAGITTGSENFTNTSVKLTETGLTTNSGIAKSASKTGTYDLVSVYAPSADTLVTGTLTSLDHFVIGDKRMNYVSSTATQTNTTYVREGSQNQEIIGIQVVTSGALDPALLTSFTFNINGTTRSADIASAKVYYTGTNPGFSATGQFGSLVANPSGSFTVNGSQALAGGANYFWLSYDVAMNVVDNDVVDAECTSVTVRGNAYIPTIMAPVGNRVVRAALTGAVAIGTTGAYPTLTGAGGLFEKIALVGLKGNVTASIVSDITEPGTNVLTLWYEAGGSGFSLTVSPDAAVNRTLSGTITGGLIRLSNATRVNFDGRFNSSGKFLTITNTAISGTIAAIQLIGTAAGQGCNNITIRNCTISNGYNGTNSYGISLGSTTPGSAGFDHDNVTIRECNISKSGRAIEADANASGLYNNLLITGNSIGSTVPGNEIIVSGIYCNYCVDAEISENNVFNIISVSAGYGIRAFGCQGLSVTGNKVTGVRYTGTSNGAGVGIQVGYNYGAQANATIINNIVNDISGNGFNRIAGISITNGIGFTIAYNSVSLSGNVSNTNPGNISAAFDITAQGSVVLKNNIFRNAIVNTSTYAIAYAIYSAMSRLNYTEIDYNDYFATGSQGLFGYSDGSPRSNINEWRISTGQDAHSKGNDPLYVSLTDLHVDLSSTVRYAANPMAGITTDYENVPRHATTPTMGALETAVDALGPFINYTPLKNTASLSARILVATLTDSTGIPVSGAGLPVLYWNIDHGLWNAATGVFLGGNQYQFTFGAGVVLSDSIFYFIAAQDTQTIPMVSVKPSAGAAGFTHNPPACSTKPTNPDAYKVVVGLNGTITVGNGGDYPSLTGTGGLFQAVKENLLNGHVNATVISDLSEPGTNQLYAWQEEGAGNYTLTVRPNSSTERLISGNVAQGMIILNGVKRFSFDGSYGDTTSQYLRIRNTNNTYTVIQFLNGAQYNTIRNCHLESGYSGITFGTSTVFSGNSFNQILYNAMHERTDATGIPYYGVLSNGTAANPNKSNTIHGNEICNFISYGVYLASTGNGGEWIISGNSFYNNLPTPPSTLQRGIYVNAGWLSFGNHITGNYIGGQSPQCGGNSWENTGISIFTGIYLDAGSATNYIQNNTISNIYQSNSDAYGFRGIMIYEGWCGISGNTIGNADLSKSIRSGSTDPVIYGIRVESGSTCHVAKNTVANLVLTATTGNPEVYGIFIYASDIQKNKLYGLGHCLNAGVWPRVFGIHNDGLSGTYTEVSNNSISIDCGSSANPQITGYYEFSYTENTVDFFYNSISISGPATTNEPTCAFYRYVDATMNMKDNILANFRQTAGGGPAYAVYFEDPANLVSDYNDFFCTHGTLAYYNGISLPDLAAWKSATSGDQHSISSDPLFLNNANNLTPSTGSPVATAGIPLTDVNEDINDSPRDPVSPTIGCYESAMTFDKTWNGSASISWNFAANWTPSGIPLITQNVMIPAATPFTCTVNVAGKVCKNIFISVGTALIITPANSLTVQGNMTIQDGGTLTNDGLLTLKGNLVNLNTVK